MTVEIEQFASTACRTTACARCDRECNSTAPEPVMGSELEGKFSQASLDFSENELLAEARRCLYCTDPKCATACAAKVNAKAMIHAAMERNYYEAARIVLSANPCALSTSRLCACEEEGCRRGCILADRAEGSIRIEKIQNFVMRAFKEMRIMPEITAKSTGKKVAVVGAGPAGLSAATFLARYGNEVHVYEREQFAGGLLMTEIAEWRLPAEEVLFEVQLLEALDNVHFHYNTNIVDFAKIRGEFDAVFVGNGKTEPAFVIENSVTSHDFLKAFNLETKLKPALGEDAKIHGLEYKLPELSGKRAVVLGAGDTALDCCQTLYRLGCDSVTLAFRKDIRGVRANRKRLYEALNEGVELMPLLQPTKVVLDESSNVVAVECQRQIRRGNTYSALDSTTTLDCDIVISAFGSKCDEETRDMSTSFDNHSMRVIAAEGDKCPVFIGGDNCNSLSVIEAVNDGRTAAVRIQEQLSGVANPEIPPFTTAVERVDISVDMNGMHFPNPFGLASAPCSGTYEHLRNAYKSGAGFVVTKTFSLAKDSNPNNCVRIVGVDETVGRHQASYNNIVMISEHEPSYWVDTIKKLKAEYPERVLVASIMASGNVEDWKSLVVMSQEAGADAVECNLSCPNYSSAGDNGATGYKMAMALGQDPDSIAMIAASIKEIATIPFYIKLTPNITHIEEIARGSMGGGATGVSLINTVNGVARITPSGYPWPQVGKARRTISGGLSGDQVRPIALRAISRLWNEVPEVRHSMFGIGGARGALTALELIYAGGSVIQVCSAIQRYSSEIFQEFISGLKFVLYCHSRPDLRAYLNSSGIQSILPYGDKPSSIAHLSTEQDCAVPKVSDIVGKGAERIGTRAQLEHPVDWRAIAQIDQEKCVGCGTCVTTCRDNAVSAIYKNEEGKFMVDGSKCVGCAVCTSACDFRAINIVETKPLKEMTEEELKLLPTAF